MLSFVHGNIQSIVNNKFRKTKTRRKITLQPPTKISYVVLKMA